MRLVNPRTGSVVETADPVHITKLIYGEGYWVLGDDGETAHDQNPTLAFDKSTVTGHAQ